MKSSMKSKIKKMTKMKKEKMMDMEVGMKKKKKMPKMNKAKMKKMSSTLRSRITTSE